jgi:hypothetical protein
MFEWNKTIPVLMVLGPNSAWPFHAVAPVAPLMSRNSYNTCDHSLSTQGFEEEKRKRHELMDSPRLFPPKFQLTFHHVLEAGARLCKPNPPLFLDQSAVTGIHQHRPEQGANRSPPP